VRDEYNLKQGHVMLDRIAVDERSRGRRAGTPAAPGSGRLAFFASQRAAFNFTRSVLAGYLPDTCRSPAISRQEIAGESPAFGGQMIQPVGSVFPLRLAAEAPPPSSSILSNRSRFPPVTLKTPGDGRHSPDGAGRHLAKLVEGKVCYARPEGNKFDIN
jgi:hypothetical protein